MKETDDISVLVCVHSQDAQHDNLLREALDSLVTQTYDDFETIVVLDECWEFTRSLVDKYRQVLDLKVFERPQKQGLAAAKNFGIGKCTGQWIAYLDADDRYMDSKLEVQRQWMLDNPDIDFCGTNAWDVMENGSIVVNCFSVADYVLHEEIVAALPQENVLCHGSMMIRRLALVSLNGYDPKSLVLGREDWDLWQRAANAGFRFMKVPERLYLYSLGTGVAR